MLLMTEDEMTHRYKELNEDPLDLSIEKWERIVKWFDEGNDCAQLRFIGNFIRSDTCALCRYSKDNNDYKCDKCLYKQYYGFKCDNQYYNGHWLKFTMKKNRANALGMLLALLEVKKWRDNNA